MSNDPTVISAEDVRVYVRGAGGKLVPIPGAAGLLAQDSRCSCCGASIFILVTIADSERDDLGRVLRVLPDTERVVGRDCAVTAGAHYSARAIKPRLHVCRSRTHHGDTIDFLHSHPDGPSQSTNGGPWTRTV